MSEIRKTGSEDQCGFGHLIDQEDDNPVKCRGCDAYLGQVETVTEHDAKEWNGWLWCFDCYYKLHPVVEDLARSHRMDEARDEFEQRRR